MKGRTRRILAALVLGGLVLAGGWGLWVIRPVLAPFLLAVAFAYLVAPLVNRLAQWGLRRTWAILVVYVFLLGAGAFAVVKLLPQVVSQIQSLTEAIPVYALRVREMVDGLQERVRDMGAPPELRDVVDRNITEMEARAVGMLRDLFAISTLQKAAGLLASLLLAPFLAYYMLRDMEGFKRSFVRAIPHRYRQEILMLLSDLDRVISGFVRGEVLLSLVVGALASLAAMLLGLRYSLLLGLWAGLMEFIPYVGPVLGAVPAVLAGLAESPLRAIEVAVAFAVIQQLESALLSPKIMAENVGLHPLTVMLAVLTGGYLLGGWGLILAVPAVGLVRVLWRFVVARLTDPPGYSMTPAAPAPVPNASPQGQPVVAQASMTVDEATQQPEAVPGPAAVVEQPQAPWEGPVP